MASPVSAVWTWIAALVLTGLSLNAGGCADALTYAKDANAKGMELYNQGNYVEAAAAFNDATRQDPRDYKSYYFEGSSYEATHQYQRAIGSYRACLDEMPLTLEGSNNKPFRYRVLDALATSIAHSESHGIETAKLEKKAAGKASVEDQWLLAKVYRYTGDADAAIEAYNKAVLIDPEFFPVAKEAGLYEASLGQSDRAIFALKKAYAVNPDDTEVNDALKTLGVVPGAETHETRDYAMPSGSPRG